MAKQATTKTDVQKAADKARDEYTKAKTANEKQDNAATKKTLETARETMRTAVKAENRERFLAVGKRRTIKARAAIRQLINVANRKTYEYSDEEATKILSGLAEAFNEVKKAFTSTQDKTAASDSFTL